MPKRSRKPKESTRNTAILLRVAAVVQLVLGLSILGWGIRHFNEPPIPLANSNTHRYSSSQQLASITSGLSLIAFAWLCYRYSRSWE